MHWMARTAMLGGALALLGGSIATADTMAGKISELNASAKTFTVKNAHGKQSFSLAKDAKVMVGDKASSFDQLKPSERVSVDWSYDGAKRVASRVEVKPDASSTAKPAPH